MRKWLALGMLAAVGCSSTTFIVDGLIESDAGRKGSLSAGPDAADPADALADDSAFAAADAQADVAHDAIGDVALDAPEAIAPSDSSTPDSGGADAAYMPDAMPDVVDAGAIVDAQPDTSDAAAACRNGVHRCNNYKDEICASDGGWEWYQGSQACCSQPGRYSYVDGESTMLDSVTGRTFYRYVGSGVGSDSNCALSLPGGRLANNAELLSLVIGKPVGGFGVCSPTIDQTAFISTDRIGWDVLAYDGCVNFLYGVSDPACAGSGSFICVR